MLEVWSLSQEQWGAIKILDKGFMTRFRTAVSRIFFFKLTNCQHYLDYGESKGMLKILQARVQQYVTRELPDVQAGFRKSRGTRDQIANILWIIEKAREFQKNICFCFIDYVKPFDCVDHNKLWKILKQM